MSATQAILDDAADALRTLRTGLQTSGDLMRRAADELESRKRRIERLHNALAGMVGLVQLIDSRSRTRPEDSLRDAAHDMIINHRYIDAVQVLALEDQL